MRTPHLARLEPAVPTDHRLERERLAALESSVRALRPSRASSLPPPPVPGERADGVALALAEMALCQVEIGERAEARRTVGDAVLILEQLTDEATIARASVLLGEALLALDAPQHARPRFARAAEIAARRGDRAVLVRSRIGLGRALVALDDRVGCEILLSTRRLCLADPAALAQIDQALRDAERLFDTPRTVKTGYGRPISVAPPKMT
jgi:hypothetical protein